MLAAATWAHVAFWRRRLGRPVTYDDVQRLATPDGCAFEIRRLKPTSPSPDPPVLLCHGVAINHRNLDADENLSLARTLRSAGRDVFLLTLRSGRSDLTAAERKVTDFNAMVDHDVPMAVRHVRATTGAEQIDYVGFSMGGMLLYACLGHTLPQLQLRRAVIIGSPGRVAHLLPVAGLLKLLPLNHLPNAPLRFLSALAAFASEWFGTFIHRATMHLPNCMPGYVRHAAVEAVQSVPGPLLGDFVRWANTDRVPRLRDGRDILAGLAVIDVPVLLIGGSVDNLCQPRALKTVYERWGCNVPHTPKRLLMVGKPFGQGDDYGHADLAIGKRCQQEVFAPIVEFLS